MSEYQPIRTIEELETLDCVDVTEGYIAGKEGWAEPGNNRSRSYWHGWRNGAADSGRLVPDDAMRHLAYLVISTGYLNRISALGKLP